MNEVSGLELPIQENVRTDLRFGLQGAIRVVLELVLEEELREMVGASRWERLGRARESGSAGAGVFGRYKRRTQEIDDTIVNAYVHGASTRDIDQITETLMGEHVGRSAVSRVTRSLNEKVEELRKAPITGPIPYLFLDATFLDARWARKVENVSALVAYGIGLDGRRQLLAVPIGAEESEDSWSELLAQLVERGLSGVQLVVADAHAGLAKAPQRLRARLAREVSKAFDAPSKAEARKRMEQLRAGRPGIAGHESESRDPTRRRYPLFSPSTFATITVRVLVWGTPPATHVGARVRDSLLGSPGGPRRGDGAGPEPRSSGRARGR